MSRQMKRQPSLLLLLLCISFGCISASFAQRFPLPSRRLVAPNVPRPRRQLLAPSIPFAESFEILDGNTASAAGQINVPPVTGAGVQIRQLLGQQLTNAVAPLSAAPLALLSGRQPGIVAPTTGAEAAQLFDDSSESEELSEEDSDEDANGDADADTDAGQPQVPQQGPQQVPQQVPQQTTQTDYNPYRDNFNDRYEDGSYVFGYALPNGVRRWERGSFSGQQNSLVVEGFYAQPRQSGDGVRYELRCYRADAFGYHPLAVEYLVQPPRVRRNELPNVRCLNLT